MSEYLKEIRGWTQEKRFERMGKLGGELREGLECMERGSTVDDSFDGLLDEAVVLWLEELRLIFPNQSPRTMFSYLLEVKEKEGIFDEIPIMRLIAKRFSETSRVIELYASAPSAKKERFREILVSRGML